MHFAVVRYTVAILGALSLAAGEATAPPVAAKPPAASAAIDPAKLSFDQDILPVVNRVCLECHGETRAKGGIKLARFTSTFEVQKAAGQWEEVLKALREGAMPPKSAKEQLTPDERERLVRWIDHTLDTINPDSVPRDPGHVVFHRLSRSEYNNTIRDLFGTDSRPADKFPADGGGGGGFDNNAETLFIPPLLLEKYLEAAGDAVDAASKDAVYTAKPTAATPAARREAAKSILTTLVRRAYRRPVFGTEVDRYLRLFDTLEKKLVPFEEAVRQTIKAVLVSPYFLFRVETIKYQAQPYEIGQHEQAVRLSYFLWASMPDDELMKLADDRKLNDPVVIEAQVQRMLKSPKAQALGEEFITQWFDLGQFRAAAGGPDSKRFPQLTPALRDAMCDEPVAYFNALLRENRSVLHLLDSDYSFLNEGLAALYGISGVKGAELRETKVGTSSRGGVLGMAGVLAATSHPLRTSPVLRGKWVLEQIFNAPPPPPPPNTPTLPNDETAKDEQSLRQRLEAHRSNPVCASCHSRIDPLGFGLENFDPIGRWRTQDVRNQPIDATGTLLTGERFSGPAELKTLLMLRKAAFARTLTEKLLSYALGRGLEFYDRTTIKSISDDLIKADYKAQTLIVSICTSYPFRFKRNQPVKAAP